MSSGAFKELRLHMCWKHYYNADLVAYKFTCKLKYINFPFLPPGEITPEVTVGYGKYPGEKNHLH